MDSAEFLDLLGNANRRRILRLLAERPCYVTEISEFLGVSPKAVIDHLRKLEEAGLVESRTDSKRRKYFSISRHIRLEVTVSPYEFGTKSAYPASSRLDITSCRYIDIDLADDEDGDEDRESEDLVALAERLRNVEQLERELSLAQRWAQGRMTELRERLESTIGDRNNRLIADILLALADGPTEVEALSREIEAPPRIIEEALDELAEDGVVTRDGRQYRLAE
jgi:ArsR family transcriptional regulator